MNIFAIDPNPVLCARALCDLRLNKMILEQAQILCTAYRYWFPDTYAIEFENILYKVTHENHPCSIWLRRDFANYQWGVDYFNAMLDEREHRGFAKHLTGIKLRPVFNKPPQMQYELDKIDFSFNSSNLYPSTGCVFTDYKLCLVNKWLQDKREPKWTLRAPPPFIMYDLKTERFNIQSLDIFAGTIMQRKILVNHPLYEVNDA